MARERGIQRDLSKERLSRSMGMRAETPSEQLFFTTVYIAGRGQTGQWTGTGFVVRYEIDAGTVDVLVTNKHVLAGAAELDVRFVQAGEDGQPLPQATQTTITDFGSESWLGHPDDEVDVAAMFLGPVVNQMHEQGRSPFYKAFSADLMLTSLKADDLDALESVTFVGYPNGLFDTQSFLPIARRGQTATPIQANYRGAPAFLIDASVFGGSSGSPVILFDRGLYQTREGGTVVGSRLILLGVLAAVHVRQTGGVVQDLPTRQIAVFDEALDLGIVFKASAIHESVELLLSRSGMRLAAGEELSEPLEN